MCIRDRGKAYVNVVSLSTTGTIVISPSIFNTHSFGLSFDFFAQKKLIAEIFCLN